MNVAYHWLKDYVKTNTPPQELAERFLLTSSVVDGIEDWSSRFSGLVTGKVLTVKPHPNADRLRIAEVQIGLGTKTIVCGAPNLEVKQSVVVALPGTTIQSLKGESITILESTIRGVTSEGMLCAASEIGLPLIHPDGILILDPQTPSGQPITDVLPIGDTVLDLEITPNRPDLLSYIGLAREVATFEKKQLDYPPLYLPAEGDQLPSFPLQVHIEATQQCARYSAICLEEVEVKPSPLWMQCRLILAGIRPINTVVDITNYVMLEHGLPLHAFNLESLLASGALTVKKAEAGEKLVTLDGVQRTLKAGDVIMSTVKDGVIDLVGIMGGQSSSITSDTTRVYLHAVTVHGPSIRRTARAMGMRTEASGRYEKGLDPELTIPALKRAVYLLQTLANAKVSSGFLDIYPKSRTERPRIHVSFARIQQVLGVNISASEAKNILQKLGFQLPVLTKSSFEAVPPSWRKDIELPEDIIEELVRIWGFDRLPSTLPVGHVKAPQPNTSYLRKKTIRHTLASLGMHESIHLSFASESDLRKMQWPLEQAICLPEPRLSQETAYLLPTHLLPFLINISGVNRAKTTFSLFEIGNIFSVPCKEEETLSILWRSNDDMESLYRRAKTDVTQLLFILGYQKMLHFKPSTDQLALYYETNSVLDIQIDDELFGQIGAVDSSLLQAFKLRNGKNILFATLPLSVFSTTNKYRLSFATPSVYPAIERDMTVIVQENLPVSRIEELIQTKQDDILKDYTVTNLYRGNPLLPDEKAVTIHFIYATSNRTLADSEVNSNQESLKDLLQDQLPARLT